MTGSGRRAGAGLAAAALLAGLGGLTATPASASDPAHLPWAMSVAQNVADDNNVYGSSPSYITWPGVNGAAGYTNRTVCSTFVTEVFKQSYGMTTTDFKTWSGSTSPSAAAYHDLIETQNRFQRVTNIADVAPGDVVASEYYDGGSSATGHVMIAAAAPTARVASKPLVSGTTQYELQVADSTSSPHGTQDTRYNNGATDDTGAGVGVLRVYTDASGTIVGYTWSTKTGSTYYDSSQRDLEVGRFQP